MVLEAAGAAIEQADVNSDCLEKPLREQVAAMVQYTILLQRHVRLERMWMQTVNLQDIVDVTVGAGDPLIAVAQRPLRFPGINDANPTHHPSFVAFRHIRPRR